MDENGDPNNSQSSSESKLLKDDLDMEEVKMNLESISNNSEASTMAFDNDADSENTHLSSKRKKKTLSLVVSNLPKNFNYTQIKNYLEDACGPCDVRMLKDKADSRTAKAVFNSQQQLAKAKTVLNSNSIDEFHIVAYDSDSDPAQDEGPQPKRKKAEEDSTWGLDMDVWRSDPRGLYGVKPQYLNTLGIKDPLQNWVLVINFRCGREELKEVMELAGDVLVCSVLSRRSCQYANVMYRHPLEALQAISMLNGQMFYGRPLTVKLLKYNGVVLPKGLNNVGTGFAKYGKPLRDVVRHYERFIKGEENGLNSILFRTPQEQATNDDEVITEGDDSKRRAKDAIENLIAEGVEIKDFVLALKAIIEAQKDESLDLLITELMNASDIDNSELDTSTSNSNKEAVGDQNASRDENENGQPISKSKNSLNTSGGANKSTPGSPKSARKTIEPSGSSKNSGTGCRSSGNLSSVRSESRSSKTQSTFSTPSPSMPTLRCRPINQIRPAGPKSGPGYQSGGSRNTGSSGPVRPMGMGGPMFGSNGPRNQMPGPSGPMKTGPMFGQSGMPSGPNRPLLGQMPGNSGSQGSMCGPSGPMAGPNGPGWSMSGPAGPVSGPNFSMPGPNTQPPFGPTVHPTSGPEATLEFNNLPLNTTFSLLSDKLSKVGQLLSIQFTVPGSVVVKYAHRAHAERCLQLFNKSRLEGNLIDVSFV